MAVLLVSTAIAAVGCTATVHDRPAPAPTIGADDIVLTVGDVGVPLRQLRPYLLVERSRLSAVSTFTGGKEDSDEILRRARADAATDVIQFELAAERGFVAGAGYSQFLDAWTAENHRRAAAIAAGEPVYGPEQYSEDNYRVSLLGSLKEELSKAFVADGTIVVTDEKIADVLRRDTSPNDAGLDPTTAAGARIARELSISEEYDRIVSEDAAKATVSLTSVGQQLSESGCAGRGAC